MQSRNPQQQQKPTCPACGNQPQKGSKAGEPICKVCGSGLSTSPLGKQAMKAAGDQAAMKFKAAMQQRQQAPQRAGGMRPGMGGPAMGAHPGAGAPQGQPQVDPRALLALLAARQGGR